MAKNPKKPKKSRTGLTQVQKYFLIQRLACYDGPTEVAEAFKAEYGIEMSPQRVETYDPTKRAGVKLGPKLRELFETTRQDFLKNAEKFIPECNKMVRVRYLVHAAKAFKGRGNYNGMADMLERIAKELGNVHTNRRELSGRDGKPIELINMTEEQIDRQLQAMLTGMMMEDEAGDEHSAIH